MIRVFVFVLISTLFFEINSKTNDTPITHFTVADTIQTGVNAIYDSIGLLNSYTARVFTPVCEVDKCYAIEINFYWDLIGRFHHYDTIPGKSLTKLDHEPFIVDDFIKLEKILKNANSPLALYSKEELVRNTRSSEIDGFTGATINEIKESVIGGAVYSCHTLWHIANGSAVDSLQKTTKKNFNENLVKKLVSKQDQEINYFLIYSFSEDDFQTYLPEVLLTIPQGKGYYAKHVFEKMPKDVISSNLSQTFFAANFNQFNYFAQVALLEKIDTNSLSSEMSIALTNSLDERNSYRNDLIRQLTSTGRKH